MFCGRITMGRVDYTAGGTELPRKLSETPIVSPRQRHRIHNRKLYSTAKEVCEICILVFGCTARRPVNFRARVFDNANE